MDSARTTLKRPQSASPASRKAATPAGTASVRRPQSASPASRAPATSYAFAGRLTGDSAPAVVGDAIASKMAEEWATRLVPTGLGPTVTYRQWDIEPLSKEISALRRRPAEAPSPGKPEKKRPNMPASWSERRDAATPPPRAEMDTTALLLSRTQDAKPRRKSVAELREQAVEEALVRLRREKSRAARRKARALLERAEDIEIEPVEANAADRPYPTAFRDTLELSDSETESLGGAGDAFRRATSGRAAPGAHERVRHAADVATGGEFGVGLSSMRDAVRADKEYVGPGARHAFFGRYATAAGLVAIATDADACAGAAGATTPRTRYMRSLVEESRSQQRHRDAGGSIADGTSVLPVPALLRRLSAPRRIDLTGLGIGDDAAFALAVALPDVPTVAELSIRACRLTDESLAKVCTVATQLKSLKWLDCSENDFDSSTAILRKYLAEPDCSLEYLGLDSADIDDTECVEIMSAIQRNTTLESLSLARNLIGQDELNNTLNDDIVTGGEAIADMLRTNKALTHLDLSWNYIRKKSAQEVAKALRHNRALRSLKIAYNMLGNLPAQELGSSLAANNFLTSLDLSYNNVSPAAALVIAAAIQKNASLIYLNLDGNSIARNGAELLHAAVRRSQTPTRFVRLSLVHCETEHNAPKLFNPVDPSGRYVLKMTTPYGQAVANELLRLARMKDMTSFRSIQHSGRREGGATINETIELEFGKPPPQHDTGWRAIAAKGAELWRKMHAEKRGRTHKQDALVVENILTLLTFVGLAPDQEGSQEIFKVFSKMPLPGGELGPQDYAFALFRAVFRIVDADHSAQMSATEMEQCLKFLGIECTYRHVQRIVRTYDVDGTGVIEEDEFVQWLTGGYLARREGLRGGLLLKGTGAEWVPPEEGVLIIEFESFHLPPNRNMIGTDIGVEGLIKNIMLAPNDAERREVIDRAIENSEIYFTAKQAHMIMDACGGPAQGVSTVELLIQLLPQMCNPEDTCQLLESTCTTLADQVRIAAKIGFSFFAVLIGNPTGFHKIDLSNENDRLAMKRIAEFANDERRQNRQSSAHGDTSQKGNWENFRNERFNDKPITLTGRWTLELPKTGILKFDYVSTTRPRTGVKPMSERRYEALWTKLGLDALVPVNAVYKGFNTHRTRGHTLFTPGTKKFIPKRTHFFDDATDDSGDEAETDSPSTMPATTSEAGSPADPVSGGMPATTSEAGGPADPVSGGMAATTSEAGGVANPESGGMPVTTSEAGSPAKPESGAKGPTGKRGSKASKGKRPTKVAADAQALDSEEAELRELINAAEREVAIDLATQLAQRGDGLLQDLWTDLEPQFIEEVAKEAFEQAMNGDSGDQVVSDPLDDGVHVLAEDDLPPSKRGEGRTFHGVFIPSCILDSVVTSAWRLYSEGSMVNMIPYFGPEKMRPGNEGKGFLKKDSLRHMPKTSATPTSAYLCVFQKLLELRIAIKSVWLTVEQATRILKAFPRKDFCRVKALCIMFRRIIDIENLYTLRYKDHGRVLHREEVRELRHRMGLLNVIDPLHPNGRFELDLRVYEQREMAKALVYLAIQEPGENWFGEEYRWGLEDKAVDGWELPLSWSEADTPDGKGGPAQSGRLRFDFVTEPAAWLTKEARKMKPQWEARENLRPRFLCGGERLL